MAAVQNRQSIAITNANSKPIVKTDISIPNKIAFTLDNVASPEFCEALIQLSESGNYERASLNVEAGISVTSETRTNYRYMLDDQTVAGLIFDRIKDFLPADLSSGKIQRKLVSLNERLRFLRYDKGQKFDRHFDGWFTRPNGERSYYTVQLYLNEDFKGGETTFFLNDDSSGRIPVVPRTGMVLVFQHDIAHEGSVLLEGRKYCIRTDVMYTQNIIA